MIKRCSKTTNAALGQSSNASAVAMDTYPIPPPAICCCLSIALDGIMFSSPISAETATAFKRSGRPSPISYPSLPTRSKPLELETALTYRRFETFKPQRFEPEGIGFAFHQFQQHFRSNRFFPLLCIETRYLSGRRLLIPTNYASRYAPKTATE